MKRAIIFIFLMIGSMPVWADWNLNGDCIVDFQDFAMFAADWDDPYDVNDLIDFASEWLNETWFYCNNRAPVAANVSLSAVQYEPTSITFSASDDNRPRPPKHLKYQVTQLPSNGYVQNFLVKETDRMTTVPDWLTGWSDTVIFATDTTGTETVKYKAYDGDLYSDEATVTITVAAADVDYLSFGSGGTVSIPDGSYLDVVDGWGIDFWIRTKESDSTLITKRSGTGAGYIIDLVDGYPRIRFFDGTNTVTVTGYSVANSGGWHEVGFSFNLSGSDVKVSAQIDGSMAIAEETGTYSTFANSEPVVIENGWGFDSLRYFSGIVDPGALGSGFNNWYDRTDTTEKNSVGFFKYSSVWFQCDEGTGTTITDVKTSQVGTFSGSVSWTNLYWDWDKHELQKTYDDF